MTVRRNKAVALEMLRERDLDGLTAWSESVRSPFRVLLSHAYNPDELIRWRTVEAVGRVAARLGRDDLEPVRELIRRLLWLMNDESGGLCRIAPELIAETLARVPELIREYAGILPMFLIEEPFERGTHWALWRLSCVRPRLFAGDAVKLKESLNDPDPAIRAYSALALGVIAEPITDEDSVRLREDAGELNLYDLGSGELTVITVGALMNQPPSWCTEEAERAA